jgi:4-amino-4-deoxy-L-arabinose transferase-like glycosyltransferase
MGAYRISKIPSSDRKWEVVLIIALWVPLILWHTGSISFLDPNEGLYGSIAREMAEGGDWVTPRFNGVRYLEKPPLLFWLSALTSLVLGPSEMAVRLWSALPALGSAILTWKIGHFIYGGRTGLLSAIILLSGVGFFRYARVAAPDLLLVFSITLSMFGLVKAIYESESSRTGYGWSIVNRQSLILFYLGIALAVLSKGLVGIVIPALTVGLFFFVTTGGWQIGKGGVKRLLTTTFSLFSLRGFLVLLLVALPWHLLAAWENPGFFQFHIVDNHFLRFFGGRIFVEDDIPVNAFAFLALTWGIWFFPWSLLFPAALRQGFPFPSTTNSQHENLRMLVGLWALVVLGFFSLCFYKLEHYFLPAIPPLSLMVGAAWNEAFSSSRDSRGVNWCMGLGALFCAFIGTVLLLYSDRLTPWSLLSGLAELNVYYRILKEHGTALPFGSVLPFVQLLQLLGGVLVVGLPLAFAFFRCRMPRASFITVGAVACLIALLVFRLLLIIEPHHSTKPVAKTVLLQAGSSDLIIHEGSLEYSGGLPFYTGRRIHLLNETESGMVFGSRFPESGHLFLDNAKFTRLWGNDGRVFLVSRFPTDASVVEHLARESVFLVGRYGARWLYSNRPMSNGS